MEDPATLEAVRGREIFNLFPRASDALSLLPPNPNNPGLLGFLCEDVEVGREVGTLISLEWEDTESSSLGGGENILVDANVADEGADVGAGLGMGVGRGLGVGTELGLALAEVIVGVDVMKDDEGLGMDVTDGAVFEVANRAAIGGMDPDGIGEGIDVDVDSEEFGPWKAVGIGGIVSTSTGFGFDLRLKKELPDFFSPLDFLEETDASER